MFGPLRRRVGSACFVAQDGGVVTSSLGTKIVADHSFADSPPLDVILVPGGLGHAHRGRTTRSMIDFVREQGQTARVRHLGLHRRLHHRTAPASSPASAPPPTGAPSTSCAPSATSPSSTTSAGFRTATCSRAPASRPGSTCRSTSSACSRGPKTAEARAAVHGVLPEAARLGRGDGVTFSIARPRPAQRLARHGHRQQGAGGRGHGPEHEARRRRDRKPGVREPIPGDRRPAPHRRRTARGARDRAPG